MAGRVLKTERGKTVDNNKKQLSEQLIELQVVDVIPSGDNPRIINEKDAAFLELAESIKAQGVIVPIHVRTHPKQKNRYELLAGERRLKATTKASRGLIPAIDHGRLNDEQAFEITFAENFAREDLTPLEQGKAVVTLMEKYKGDTEAVASKMGKSIKWVRQRQALGTKLSKAWRKALTEDSDFQNWTASHLQRVAALPESMQTDLLDSYNYNDQPTLKELDTEIAEMLQLLSKAPFDTSTAGCTKCRKRTSCQPGLFDDNLEPEALKKNDRCLDRICWEEKTRSWLRVTFDAKKTELPNLCPIATEYIRTQSLCVNEFPKLLTQYDFESASKKAKGAIPGFVVYGKALGTVLWIKPRSYAAENRSGKSTGKPTSLKERWDMLYRKRWFVVLRVLREKVEGLGVEAIFYEFDRLVVMALAGIIGTWEKHDSLYSRDTTGDWETLRQINEEAKANPEGAWARTTEKLWEEVRPVLTSRLTYNDAITRTPDNYIEEAKNIAVLLQIDIDALFKIASEEDYPEPRSWKNLNADGTP